MNKEECYKILDELLIKYPNSVKDILITLKDVAREYELWERLDKDKEKYKEYCLEWLERLYKYEN
jgi:flavoprotein